MYGSAAITMHKVEHHFKRKKTNSNANQTLSMCKDMRAKAYLLLWTREKKVIGKREKTEAQIRNNKAVYIMEISTKEEMWTWC